MPMRSCHVVERPSALAMVVDSEWQLATECARLRASRAVLLDLVASRDRTIAALHGDLDRLRAEYRYLRERTLRDAERVA